MLRHIAVIDDTALQRLRANPRAAILIGLGTVLLAINVVPDALHAPLVLACIALVFGALYAFGVLRQRWVRIPAMFFGSLAVALFFHILFFHTGSHDFFGFGVPIWPVLLIVVGLLLMRRERRWAA